MHCGRNRAGLVCGMELNWGKENVARRDLCPGDLVRVAIVVDVASLRCLQGCGAEGNLIARFGRYRNR